MRALLAIVCIWFVWFSTALTENCARALYGISQRQHQMNTALLDAAINFVAARRHVCEECGNTFSSKFSFKRHLKRHTGERPYRCTVSGCGRFFAEKSTMMRHHKTHSKPHAGTEHRADVQRAMLLREEMQRRQHEDEYPSRGDDRARACTDDLQAQGAQESGSNGASGVC